MRSDPKFLLRIIVVVKVGEANIEHKELGRELEVGASNSKMRINSEKSGRG